MQVNQQNASHGKENSWCRRFDINNLKKIIIFLEAEKAVLFVIARTCKKPKYPSAKECIFLKIVHLNNKILLSSKTITYWSLQAYNEKSGEYHLEWGNGPGKISMVCTHS